MRHNLLILVKSFGASLTPAYEKPSFSYSNLTSCASGQKQKNIQVSEIHSDAWMCGTVATQKVIRFLATPAFSDRKCSNCLFHIDPDDTCAEH